MAHGMPYREGGVSFIQHRDQDLAKMKERHDVTLGFEPDQGQALSRTHHLALYG